MEYQLFEIEYKKYDLVAECRIRKWCNVWNDGWLIIVRLKIINNISLLVVNGIFRPPPKQIKLLFIKLDHHIDRLR